MKKIGLIGGMSWESTLVYYQIMNQKVRHTLGGSHSCKLVLESVDFAEIESLQHQGQWDTLNQIMAYSAENLEKVGAELIILCTNTMHLCTEAIRSRIQVPFVHIVEATGIAIRKDKLDKVLLLGTRFTMESDLYRSTLKNQFNIDVSIPKKYDLQLVHDVIYKELIHGVINPVSKKLFKEIISRSTEKDVQGVILGCTEIPLLLKEKDVDLKVYDTTTIHAEAAVDLALKQIT